MNISEDLKIPAYLLDPIATASPKSTVMAIHGHGSVEPCIGQRDDYHHFFALEMAKDGHLVLCPELRGFSTLNDLAFDIPINRLDYWIGGYSQFTLVTDGFLFGKTLIGETVEDLLRWEDWLSRTHGVESLDVAGISYGGDLCLSLSGSQQQNPAYFCQRDYGIVLRNFPALLQCTRPLHPQHFELDGPQ